MIDDGKVEGTLLYVYGSVTAEGNETKGDTVNGTWASNGCDPRGGQKMLENSNNEKIAIMTYYECRTS